MASKSKSLRSPSHRAEPLSLAKSVVFGPNNAELPFEGEIPAICSDGVLLLPCLKSQPSTNNASLSLLPPSSHRNALIDFLKKNKESVESTHDKPYYAVARGWKPDTLPYTIGVKILGAKKGHFSIETNA